MQRIRKAAVLGSGVMGASIAAHLANVGIETLLLDMVPQTLLPEEEARGLTLSSKEVRNRLANAGKARLLKTKPSPLYDPAVLDLITTGNFEDDLVRLKDVDWIIEVVVERLDVKRDLLARVEAHWREGTIVSTNTSGISIEAMVEGRSEAFQAHFLGTHFFNPPRYLKLLEIIPHTRTKPEIIQGMRTFAERRLGKGVVIAKDTPNFIANRIGTYGLLVTVHAMQRFGLGVDEVDEITGPAMGRPKSATFRTLDVVGLDTFVHVAQNVYDHVSDSNERDIFRVPDIFLRMVEAGMIGEKSGQGFYKKVKQDGKSEILTLDVDALTYRPRKRIQSPALAQGKGKDLATRLQLLLFGEDKASKFAWEITKKTLLYAAQKVGEIADDITAIDQAMRWGFGWELGPFELWDTLGVKKVAERMKKEGDILPDWVEALLKSDQPSFYRLKDARRTFYHGGQYVEENIPKERISLAWLKASGKKIAGNSGASLVDLGDGVLCLEFHSTGNALGVDTNQMAEQAFRLLERDFEGMVIGNQGKNFSAGANLMLMLMEAQDENWDEIDLLVRQFQAFTMRIKTSEKPIVAAPFGMTLGGGYEVAAAASRMQLAAETYMGLVETGVGLIPGGGGTKELLIRFMERLPEGSKADPLPFVSQVFETIALAKVSTSAHDALRLGYARASDGITIDQDRLLYDAKQQVLHLIDQGYIPRRPQKIRVLGEAGYAALSLGIYSMKNQGLITDHDAKIAHALAFVLTGGRVPKGTLVDEQYLLDLEREAFLSLIGEPKTQMRMQHMLAKGKPLRN
ncbi:MAG: 3-hydroxyacyl-CoA dehydrogenase NAD-binding domain-containing protein [Candidatus Carbobacillus sp.]|nr:3-hydroxyacyl-CoA dehydrogenase NAD-binding domain-containing protein [Candidatus Carbobacillus sp.]